MLEVRPNVLIVDDDPGVLESLSLLLGDDCEVVTCASSLEALGLATWSTFDAHDHVLNQTWTWRQDNYVRLGPDSEPVHILSVRSH